MRANHRDDFVALLYGAADRLVADLSERMQESGYGDVRGAHGCVFANLVPEGMRLTELAELAGMTKQAVGEAVSDLEGLGYAERVPDPNDGRAKTIRLTERGIAAQRAGFQVIGEIEQEWIERYGADRVSELRSMLLDLNGSPRPLASAA